MLELLGVIGQGVFDRAQIDDGTENRLSGTKRSDLVVGKRGTDTLAGMARRSTLSYRVMVATRCSEGRAATMFLATPVSSLKGKGKGDKLFGGPGNDKIVDGAGNVRPNGEAGVDKFISATDDDSDTIADFASEGCDHSILVLRGLRSVRHQTDLRNVHLVEVGDNPAINGLKAIRWC